MVESIDGDTLLPLITKRVVPGSTVCSDTGKDYTGIASRGYVHRLVNHGERQYTDEKGNHINGLEGFWGYLKRKLASKGGITRSRLPLYLAEYIWRYNHRSDPERIKVRRIIQLLEKS
jgi:transposase